MKNLFTRMIREEEGQGLVEYGLIIAGIALAAIAAIWLLLGFPVIPNENARLLQKNA